MVIIHSSSNDRSTITVLAWLFHFGIRAKRVNDELQFPEDGIRITNHQKCTNGTMIFNYWFRRGSIIVVREKINPFDCNNFKRYIDSDLAHFTYLFNSQLAQNNYINLPRDNEINKLLVYSVAKDLKVLFPETWVGSNLEHCPFLKNKKRFIAKSLNYPNLIVKFKGTTFQLHSSNILIEENKLTSGKVPSKFMPSLFQEYIEKRYELRIFYLRGEFYSMAIFSQQNEKTKIDFRNYDEEKPNRCVRYQLPKYMQILLDKMMRKLNLNCGSIDMIVTPTGEYYFLEVNPIGQFQWLSNHCNYYIERRIAKQLCNL